MNVPAVERGSYDERTRERLRGEIESLVIFSETDDPWFGALHQFPTVLHARASFSFDIHAESLQKSLLSALSSLRGASLAREISVADRDGYSAGRVGFRVGIGNGEGFDILNEKEMERVRGRIENLGPFNILDLIFNLHYRIDDGREHRVHRDDYILRLVFQPGRVELLVHHLKGVRRVGPAELVELLVGALNSELGRSRFSEVELETLSST